MQFLFEESGMQLPPSVAKEGRFATCTPKRDAHRPGDRTKLLLSQATDPLSESRQTSSASGLKFPRSYPAAQERVFLCGHRLVSNSGPSVPSHPITSHPTPWAQPDHGAEMLAVPPDTHFKNHSTQRQNALSPVAQSSLLLIEQLYQ